MTAGGIRVEVLALLEDAAGPVLVVGRDAGRWQAVLCAAGRMVAGPTDAATAALVTFTGERGDPDARRRRLAHVRERLGPGAPLLVIDHNQPRQWWWRPIAAVQLAARGMAPGRGRYPSAREVDAAGFRVQRLRLAAGERLQLVLALREA